MFRESLRHSHSRRARLTGFMLALAAALGPLAQAQVQPGLQKRSAAHYVPADVSGAIVVWNGPAHLEQLAAFLEDSALTEEGPLGELLARPEVAQARIMLLGLSAAAGADAWTLAGDILGEETVLAFKLGDGSGQPAVFAAAMLREPERVERLLNGVYGLTGHVKNGVPDASRTFEVAGVRVFQLGNAYQALHDGVLLLSNQREMLEQVLSRGASSEDRLAQDRSYWRVRREVPEDTLLWAFLRVDQVRERIAARREIPERLDNPLGGLLFGGWWHSVRSADTALAWVRRADGAANGVPGASALDVQLQLLPAAELPDTHRGFHPRPVAVAWNARDLPSYMGEISVERDWAGLFSQRETLLTVQGASQLVNFSTTMSTLLGGLDFMNDVLPAIHGPTRFIAARQDFARREPLPVPKLPAFALVAPLAEQQVARLSQRLSTGLQMAVSILNLENAQQGRPTYVIDVDRHAGVRYFFTDFGIEPDAGSMSGGMSGETATQPDGADPPASAPAGAEGGVRYNFRPAAAIVGNELVITTSAELLREIIDAATAARPSAEKPADAPPPGDYLRIDGAALTGLLRENRRELIINGVLEGKSQTTAENEIDMLLSLAAFVTNLQLDLSRGPDAVRARAHVEFDWNARLAPAKPERDAKP